jgi:hypothetical protein
MTSVGGGRVEGVPCDGVIVNDIEDRGVYELWGVRWKSVFVRELL